MMCAVLVLFMVILAAANLYFIKEMEKEKAELHKVEGNRIAAVIKQGLKENENADLGMLIDSIPLSAYKTIMDIRYLEEGASFMETEEFYRVPVYDAMFYPIALKKGNGYIKLTFWEGKEKEGLSLLILLNVIVICCFFILLAVLIYIKRKLIMPFEQIKEYPVLLAKGNLVQGLKEQREGYFGKFLWGLDMLRETLEDRKQKNLELEREKKTMLLSLSHDLKTPLSSIYLYGKALEKGLYDQKEKRNQAVTGILEKAALMEDYIGRIIAAATEDFLHIPVNPGEFYLKDLLGELTGFYGEKLSLLHTELVIESYENCLLYGDFDRALEVFENIMENAVKYGDGKEIRICFEREEGCMLVTVENTGNSLPKQELSHIFESFYRGSNGKGKSGSGLGLYICREILHKMRGEVFAEIEKGKMRVTVVFEML